MSSSDDNWSGEERRHHQVEGVHRWRWRSLAVWVVIFSIVVGWNIRAQRQQIQELRRDKASIESLQKTDCGLRDFLLTARAARLTSAKHEKGKAKLRDLGAAAGYLQLARQFAVDGCSVTHSIR